MNLPTQRRGSPEPHPPMSRQMARSLFFNSYKCRQLYTLLDAAAPSSKDLEDLGRQLELSTADIRVFLDVLLTLDLVSSLPSGDFMTRPWWDDSITEIQPREHAALTQDLLGDLALHGSESLFFCVATDESRRKDFIQQFKSLVSKFCSESRSTPKGLIYSVSLSTTKFKGVRP